MRRPAILLGLLACLMGSPLRLAEAAGDAERALAGLLRETGLQEIDGGVGDDPGVGTPAEAHEVPAGEAPFGVDTPFPALSMAPGLARYESRGRRRWPGWPNSPPARRHAWLQVFRF